MKPIKILVLLIFFASALNAQTSETAQNTERNTEPAIKQKKFQLQNVVDPTPNPIRDPALFDSHGDLLNDDPYYNKKSPITVPIFKVIVANAEVWAIDRYVFNYDYSRIGFNSWKNNIKQGWEWDNDRFGVNFFGHPYTGGGYFNAGRSTGFTFYESIPFAAFGSVLWEYFGETTRPSYSDFLNTTINGAFGGEILYRLSSNVLDDRTTGAERVLREATAAILSPSRFTSRLFQGKLFEVVDQEVYQKEVLNTTIYGGGHLVNESNKFASGPISEIMGLQFEYGNPFEQRDRKPYDVFKLRGELNFGVGRKIIDNTTGYGLLFGSNYNGGNTEMLLGAFQQYDYWDNSIFELGAIGIGGGAITKITFSPQTNLFTTFHLAFVPLAGNSSIQGPDTLSKFRDYNYGGGAEAELETSLNLWNRVRASLIGNYYWVHTYVGLPGNNFVGIVKPKITLEVFKDVSLGFEHIIYYDDRYPRGDDPPPSQHFTRTEQKFFLQIYFENSQRGGRFN
jgi:hypothetical protein